MRQSLFGIEIGDEAAAQLGVQIVGGILVAALLGLLGFVCRRRDRGERGGGSRKPTGWAQNRDSTLSPVPSVESAPETRRADTRTLGAKFKKRLKRRISSKFLDTDAAVCDRDNGPLPVAEILAERADTWRGAEEDFCGHYFMVVKGAARGAIVRGFNWDGSTMPGFCSVWSEDLAAGMSTKKFWWRKLREVAPLGNTWDARWFGLSAELRGEDAPVNFFPESITNGAKYRRDEALSRTVWE